MIPQQNNSFTPKKSGLATFLNFIGVLCLIAGIVTGIIVAGTIESVVAALVPTQSGDGTAPVVFLFCAASGIIDGVGMFIAAHVVQMISDAREYARMAYEAASARSTQNEDPQSSEQQSSDE
jgi:hypothetical protein